MNTPKHPFQPLIKTPDGVVRFKPNQIIERLVQERVIDLNQVARMHGISNDDRQHFNQLHGYSVSGWGDLNCVDRDTCNIADEMADRFMKGIPYTEDQVKIEYLESQLKQLREATFQAISGLTNTLNLEVEQR